jgi:hypothetical protein
MSWIDEASKRAEKFAREREAAHNEQVNRFRADIKMLLPHGVEIVGLPIVTGFRESPEGIAVARINLGNGVQFDLKKD